MREAFETWRPNADTTELLNKTVAIITDYAAQGYRLSVRQVYYQLVGRDIIENTVPSYKRLGRIIRKARMAGIVDWAVIEDRNRTLVKNNHYAGIGSYLKHTAQWFEIDLWEGQDNRPIVICEKDALSGILQPICEESDVYFTANKGYSSISHLYNIAKNIEHRATNDYQGTTILYFGDHDPSGLDMDRDILERVGMFSFFNLNDVKRLALTAEQIETYDPPPNPAKMTDTRAPEYIAEHGDSSWELDALQPEVLGNLVRGAIEDTISHPEQFEEMQVAQEDGREQLKEIAQDYD